MSTTKYLNMDFNYNDDNATGSAVNTNGDGSGGDSEYLQHMSPTAADNGRPARPLETEHQLTNLSMPKKKSSILGASSNLVNSIVGELRVVLCMLFKLCTSYAHIITQLMHHFTILLDTSLSVIPLILQRCWYYWYTLRLTNVWVMGRYTSLDISCNIN